MLKRMVEEALREVASTEWFRELVGQIVHETTDSAVFKRHVSAKIKKEIDAKKMAVSVSVDDGDIIVFPNDGISDEDFAMLSAMVPSDKRIGVIAANGIKILKLT